MHLMDGVLPLPVVAGGFVGAGALCAWSAYKIKDEEIPRIAVFTAAFFVASLIHIKTGPTSVHLVLNGLVGVVLGRRCCLAFPIGLFLQAVLQENGGVSVLGVNTCIFAIPALVSWRLYHFLCRWNEHWRFAAGVISGAMGVLLSAFLVAIALRFIGEGFDSIAKFVFLAHIPVMLIEGAMTGLIVQFLARAQPALLKDIR